MNAITTKMGHALAPSTYAEARSFAEMVANSDMVPKDYKGRPGNVMVAMQWGSEIGLGPLQAMQNIAVINGRPSIWGDAALALVRGHPACQSVQEGVEGEGEARHGWCEVTRRGEKPQRRTFSVIDAKKAGLWGKAGPWQQYPDRMLQLRARGFAIRDVFPDALRGVITVEEARDMPVEPLPPASGPTIQGRAEAAPAPTFAMIDPAGVTREAPSPQAWVQYCRRAIAAISNDGFIALREWSDAMAPHFAAMDEVQPQAVLTVRNEVEEALDAIAQTVPGAQGEG